LKTCRIAIIAVPQLGARSESASGVPQLLFFLLYESMLEL
jgi:hypothetical protein